MKKYLAIILGMLLVLAMVAVASAETKFTMSGDARVRGTWQNDYDFNNDADADKRWWEHRIRLAIDAVADGGSSLHTRLSLTDWNQTWTGSGEAGGLTEPNSRLLDYAYINVPLGNGVTATLGKVIVGWGKGFWAWDRRAYRLLLGKQFGDTKVVVFTQKSLETNVTGDKNLDDNDAYSILAIHKTKNLTVGGIYVYANAKALNPIADGHAFNVYFDGKAGAINYFGEFVYTTGDANEQVNAAGNKKKPYGGFVHLDYTMGNVTLVGAVALAQNGFTSDNDFNPTFFYGTAQSTAALNFGGNGDTFAILGAVVYKVSNDLSLMGKLAYANVDKFSSSQVDVNLTELDLGLTYKINKSTTYNIDFGYLKPDIKVAGAKEDPAMALAHRIVVNF
ncbi:MAG: hypothetical protein AABY42_09145 [Nitrospirota bacterium]